MSLHLFAKNPFWGAYFFITFLWGILLSGLDTTVFGIDMYPIAWIISTTALFIFRRFILSLSHQSPQKMALFLFVLLCATIIYYPFDLLLIGFSLIVFFQNKKDYLFLGGLSLVLFCIAGISQSQINFMSTYTPFMNDLSVFIYYAISILMAFKLAQTNTLQTFMKNLLNNPLLKGTILTLLILWVIRFVIPYSWLSQNLYIKTAAVFLILVFGMMFLKLPHYRKHMIFILICTYILSCLILLLCHFVYPQDLYIFDYGNSYNIYLLDYFKFSVFTKEVKTIFGFPSIYQSVDSPIIFTYIISFLFFIYLLTGFVITQMVKGLRHLIHTKKKIKADYSQKQINHKTIHNPIKPVHKKHTLLTFFAIIDGLTILGKNAGILMILMISLWPILTAFFAVLWILKKRPPILLGYVLLWVLILFMATFQSCLIPHMKGFIDYNCTNTWFLLTVALIGMHIAAFILWTAKKLQSPADKTTQSTLNPLQHTRVIDSTLTAQNLKKETARQKNLFNQFFQKICQALLQIKTIFYAYILFAIVFIAFKWIYPDINTFFYAQLTAWYFIASLLLFLFFLYVALFKKRSWIFVFGPLAVCAALWVQSDDPLYIEYLNAPEPFYSEYPIYFDE